MFTPFLESDQAFQQSREDLKNWKPDPPLDLSGPLPTDDDVRAAIKQAVDYLLEKQNENGAWDVELTGSLLSEVADQAVDSTAVTALCGLALRRHIKVDPAKIEVALTKAADVIMDRIIRGKLSTKVYYAVWRYTWGLKFLSGEFKATKNEDRRAEIKGVARRMVQSLLKMQLSNSPIPLMDRARRARISKSDKKIAKPSNMGIALALPTDDNYRGGAVVSEVLPGSAGEKGGLKVGDRIVKAEGIKIENAFDFYPMETGWLGGQSIELWVERGTEPAVRREVKLETVWPGYIGIQMIAGPDGVTVDKLLRFSPAKSVGVEVGDVVFDIDKTPVKTVEDFLAIEAKVKPLQKLKFSLGRGSKKKAVTVEAAVAPEGTFGFAIQEEDKSEEGGVVLENISEQGAADRAGMKKNDRLMKIGHTPILGLDHYLEFEVSLAAGRTVKCLVKRDGEEVEVDVKLDALVNPGDPQFEPSGKGGWGGAVIVESLKKGGVSEKAGLKVGDVIKKLNGTDTSNLFTFIFLFRDFGAGDEVVLTIERGGKEVDLKLMLAEYPKDADVVEEGGWNYYPMGVAVSFASATTLMTLIEVAEPKEGMGLPVPVESLAAAANLIQSMHKVDTTNGGIEGYIYRSMTGAPPDRIKMSEDVRGHMGRITCCEQAMVMANERKIKTAAVKGHTRDKLKKQLDLWLKHRGELDKVRRFWHTHNYNLYANAAYYWMYGHFHTMQAANFVGGPHKKKVGDICLKALMLTRSADGTWNDHESFGPLVGTAEALMIFGEIEGAFRDGYNTAAAVTPDKPKEAPKDPPK
ncbi:MAG: PDZ domain-containing protein [Planctomycetes bacterium]|nr:PDZ domain-containing protein [Planctomycetota bacterium]